MDETRGGAPVAPVRAGLTVSITSIVWTAVASGLSILAGVVAGSGLLVAFGGVGFFDAAGSLALVIHFRHILATGELREEHDQIVRWVISVGLFVVGLYTAVSSSVRLAHRDHTTEPALGLVVAAASVVALVVLSRWKVVVARRIPSRALRADGHLSAVGVATAAVTLAGTALTDAGIWWFDPCAAIVVAAGAIAIGVVTLRA